MRSYSSIYALGHRETQAIFDDPVVVEEKIDGSQFSFGIIDGEIQCRSKGAQIILDAPPKMFNEAVATVKELAPDLRPDVVYRGEYLQKPKHNALSYSRVPAKHIILFDIDAGMEDYFSPDSKRTEAGRLGLECVPTLFEGRITTRQQLMELMTKESVLGGVEPEGMVVKNYSRYNSEKKLLIAKYVTERFKEVHRVDWKASNPGRADVVERLIEAYRTDARWQKGVQHLREAGTLDGSPKDIGPLMKEVSSDVHKECRDEIAQKLFEHFWPQISRGVTNGLPQWYKDQLVASAF